MSPSASRVIIAGGGPAAVEALLALRHLAGDRVSLELIAPNRELVVRAYEVLAPFHAGHEHRYPLAQIVADLDAELVVDALGAVDADARLITLRSGDQRRYDALIVAVGARPVAPLPGAIPFNPRFQAMDKTVFRRSRNQLQDPIGHGSGTRLLTSLLVCGQTTLARRGRQAKYLFTVLVNSQLTLARI